jgi:repressor LexA
MGRQKQLSKEQILQAINRWLADYGVPPTIEELRRILKLGSTRTVLRYLRWLEDAGDIQRWPGARGLRPLRASADAVDTRSIPLVGEAPAGPLMLAEENLEGWVHLPTKLTPVSSRFFLLRVRGDSMNRARVKDDHIEDGDLILVRQQPVADNGEIIVALIDGQATIKRLATAPGYYFLKPDSANPLHRPILLDQDFQIQGVVVRIFKKGSVILDSIE